MAMGKKWPIVVIVVKERVLKLERRVITLKEKNKMKVNVKRKKGRVKRG
jgi:hypothetical protein